MFHSSGKKRWRQDRQRYIKALRLVLFFSGLFALLVAAHLAHSGVLWAEEDLPLAAGLRMLRGAALYRDIWFDKPPLVPAVYLLWTALHGAFAGFYPYPFLNVNRIGYEQSLMNVGGLIVAFVCLILALVGIGRVLSRGPHPEEHVR